ncbi:MAG: polynucleotide kinase-phosphatase [Thermomicrobiales bacterium]
MRKLTVPTPSLVALIGVSGSGKSTFARTHFLSTEVVSSDFCRGLVADDENSLEATPDAFDVLHFIAAKRLERGLLTVIDATNVQREARASLVRLAREHHLLAVAIVLNMPERLCRERNQARPDRDFGAHVIRRQAQALRSSLRNLEREGFRYVHILSSPEEVEAAVVNRQPLWVDRRAEHGPFDIIGDIHGCFEETRELLTKLGYGMTEGTADDGGTRYEVTSPAGRTAIFLGDLTDRGPDSAGVLRLVMDMVSAGVAICLPGNHDDKLFRKLKGRDVRIAHGLDLTLQQLEREPPAFARRVIAFLDGLHSHYVLDDGKLVVAHAGMKAEYQGRASRTVREFALYGDVTGEADDEGLPIRGDWPSRYRGSAMVVYGHTAVAEPEWLNNTIDIDTGCVFGGRLTCLRYPERELMSVPARATYFEHGLKRRGAELDRSDLSAQQQSDDLLDLADVSGRRTIAAQLMRSVTIRDDQAHAALEAMSRFAVDPKWLIYLPPTMSPVETSSEPTLLEHPREAFAFYRGKDVQRVIIEEKHMGSRAIVVLCQDAAVAHRRFGVSDDADGIIYTRTGRRFFKEREHETAILARLHSATLKSGVWGELGTDWMCLDAELMPWSAKAQDLLRNQYAATGSAALAALGATVDALTVAKHNGIVVDDLLERTRSRLSSVEAYVASYRRYAWPVETVADFKLAPFHLLASEGQVHADKDHGWHIAMLERLCREDPELLLATAHRVVDVGDEESESAAISWWRELTDRGGEGIVVKPWEFIRRGPRGLVQPALKVRGHEYLRIIYGPEYTMPENLDRLRARGLAAKRSLALREFALGIEALSRFVQCEPLRRVHECVFGVLALESEPIDPRL